MWGVWQIKKWTKQGNHKATTKERYDPSENQWELKGIDTRWRVKGINTCWRLKGIDTCKRLSCNSEKMGCRIRKSNIFFCSLNHLNISINKIYIALCPIKPGREIRCEDQFGDVFIYFLFIFHSIRTLADNGFENIGKIYQRVLQVPKKLSWQCN